MLTRCVLALALLLSIPGCMSGYASTAPIAPLLTGRGDVVGGVNVRPGFPRSEASAYVAAAPSESTRVYVAGAHTRARGQRGTDRAGRDLKGRNDSNELELGGGWGRATPHLRGEVLAGVAYGAVQSTQGRQTPLADDGDFVEVWLQAQGHYVRGSLQAEAVAHFGKWSGGGGSRLSLLKLQYDEVLDHPGGFYGSVALFEPFMVQRIELPFGCLQLMVDVPIVVYSPSIALSHMANGVTANGTAKLIETPSPRIFLGFQANIDQLWRKRDGQNR